MKKNTAADNLAILIVLTALALLMWVSVRTDKAHRPLQSISLKTKQ